MTETQIINKKIRPYLESRGVLVIKYHGGIFSEAGVADLLCCYHGRFVALEVKKPYNKLSPIQAAFFGRVKTAGGLAFCIFTDTYKKDIDTILDALDKYR